MSVGRIIRILLCMSQALLLRGAWYKPGNYKLAINPYSTSTSTDCESRCSMDSNCNGYSIDLSNKGCHLSRCDDFSDALHCSKCYFASKLPPSSSVICPSETTTTDSSDTTPGADTSSDATTTEDLGMSTTVLTDVNGVDGHTSSASPDYTSTSSDPTTADVDTSSTVLTSTGIIDYSQPTNPSPVYSQPTNPSPDYSTSGSTQITSNVTCVCVCEDVNITLQESIDKRKKELIVNKKELSSSIRKLTSAEDSRVSSRNIGVMGILVMAVFGLLSLCTDIFSVLRYFCKKVSKHHHA